MKIAKQEVLYVQWSIPKEYILKRLEEIGRTCYLSQAKEDSAPAFVQRLIDSKHETILEFAQVTIKIITNRAIANELVRHRVASYAQESTRYCLYSKNKFDNQITVIRPIDLDIESQSYRYWLHAMKEAEHCYLNLVTGALGETVSIEIARDILPLALKTEIVMSCNIRELRHMIKLRTASNAHPMIRSLFTKILEESMVYCPILFKDLSEVKVEEKE